MFNYFGKNATRGIHHIRLAIILECTSAIMNAWAKLYSQQSDLHIKLAINALIVEMSIE